MPGVAGSNMFLTLAREYRCITAPTLAPTTRENAERVVERGISDFGREPLSKLTAERVECWWGGLHGQRRVPRHELPSPGTHGRSQSVNPLSYTHRWMRAPEPLIAASGVDCVPGRGRHVPLPCTSYPISFATWRSQSCRACCAGVAHPAHTSPRAIQPAIRGSVMGVFLGNGVEDVLTWAPR